MDQPKELKEEKLSSAKIYTGDLLHVFRDEIKLPDGRQSAREWIKHPGASAIVPVFKSGEVMLLRQYRYPVQEVLWEVPAGKIDPEETHLQAAKRELFEETGLKAGKLHYLGFFYPAVGYSNEAIHIYAATELQELKNDTDEDEFLIPQKILFEKTIAMIDNGEITDGKTITCLMRAWRWWNELSK